MCKFIGKSNEQILCKLSKSEILRLYSIVHGAMEITKTSNFAWQSKYSISIFFSLWAATLLLPWFGEWHILTNCQNCVHAATLKNMKDVSLTTLCILMNGKPQIVCNSCKYYYWSQHSQIQLVECVFIFLSLFKLNLPSSLVDRSVKKGNCDWGHCLN